VRRAVPRSPIRRGPGRPRSAATTSEIKPPAPPKKPKRARRKITDPAVLQRARDNLAKARLARAPGRYEGLLALLLAASTPTEDVEDLPTAALAR
jgi:hypothetical protein